MAFWSVALVAVAAALLMPRHNEAVSMGIQKTPIPAPDFTQQHPSQWLNSAPLRMKDLEGQVVLLDFWTYECWNCYRSFPWLHSVEARFHGASFQVIGVHAPEFDHERDINNVRKKVAEFKLKHPVMIDNDFRYWRAMNNRYWPAFYVIDKRGFIRGIFVGETHKGDKRARAIEELIAYLLAEKD